MISAFKAASFFIRAVWIAVFFLLPSASFLHAAESTPAGAPQSFLDTVKSMEFPVKDPDAHQFKVSRASSFLDLEAMGKKGLGAHWDKASQEDRQIFMDLLWKLIESIAYRRTRNFMEGKTVTYLDPKPLEKGFEVESSVSGGEAELAVPVVYHVAENGGQWKIYDIFLDGISMTEDLSYQFDKLIRDSGFSGLLERMRERLAQAQKEALSA